jgi:HrpA-like RNA helicase
MDLKDRENLMSNITNIIPKSHIVVYHANSNVFNNWYAMRTLLMAAGSFNADNSTNNKIYFCTPTKNPIIHSYQKQMWSQFKIHLINTKNWITHICHNDVVFCTPEKFLDKMLHFNQNLIVDANNAQFCSTVILYDFHTRTKDIDLCICTWITMYNTWKKSQHFAKLPRLILVSSTVDHTMNEIITIVPFIIESDHRLYPILILFDSKSEKYHSNSMGRYKRAAKIAYWYYKNRYNGTYLIFVPGKYESGIVKNILKKKISDGIEIVDIYDNTYPKKMEKNVKCLEKVGIRIIITNQSLSLFGIRNVTLVLDTLTSNEYYYDSDGIMCTNYRWISKSESKQRMNNIDVTNAGIYIALQSEENYSKFSENVLPEMTYISLDNDILKLIKFRLDPVSVMASSVPKNKIIIRINHLRNLGLIDSAGLTKMGFFCCEIPLEIRKAAMFYHALCLKSSDQFLYLAVICTLNCYGSGIFSWPNCYRNDDKMLYSIQRDSIMQHFEDKYGGYSDVDTILNVWTEICSHINPFNFLDLKCYCKYNSLNYKQFKETILLLKKCFLACKKMGIRLYYDHKSFKRPNIREFGNTFYYLSSLTQSECETTIYYNYHGKLIATCNGHHYKIDNRSIHRMILGNDKHKIYYSLVRTRKNTIRGIVSIINVLHAKPDNDDDCDVIGIFSSDTEQNIDINY